LTVLPPLWHWSGFKIRLLEQLTRPSHEWVLNSPTTSRTTRPQMPKSLSPKLRQCMFPLWTSQIGRRVSTVLLTWCRVILASETVSFRRCRPTPTTRGLPTCTTTLHPRRRPVSGNPRLWQKENFTLT
jgi:hypothetical protein